MSLEKEKVISKLKEEGIDEKFGEGVNFETEEELNTWVGNAKTLLVKPKALKDYTVEDFEEWAKNGSPEEKGLQAYIDRVRTAASKKKEETKKEPVNEPQESEEVKEMKAKIDQLLSEHEAEKKEREESKKKTTFDSLFGKYSKGLEDEDKVYIKATLTADSSEDDIKKAVGDYKALMAKRGFEDFGVDSATEKKKNGLGEDQKKFIHEWAEAEQKKSQNN